MTLTVNIIDEFISPEVVQNAINDWPANDWPGWHKYSNGKRASRTNKIPQSCQVVVDQIIDHVASVYPDILPDTTLWGSGLHDMRNNASLGFHRDAKRHQLNPYWTRAATAIVYLDTLEHGGELVFGEAVHTRVLIQQTITSLAGRLVLFTDPPERIVHGVRPVGENIRRTITVFFWTQNSSPVYFAPTRSKFLAGEGWDDRVIYQP